jgi:hypothetical protein
MATAAAAAWGSTCAATPPRSGTTRRRSTWGAPPVARDPTSASWTAPQRRRPTLLLGCRWPAPYPSRPPRPRWCPVLLPGGRRPSWGRSTGWSWFAAARAGDDRGTPSWSTDDLPRGARALAPLPSRIALAPPPCSRRHLAMRRHRAHTTPPPSAAPPPSSRRAANLRLAAGSVQAQWGGDLNASIGPHERTRATALWRNAENWRFPRGRLRRRFWLLRAGLARESKHFIFERTNFF